MSIWMEDRCDRCEWMRCETDLSSWTLVCERDEPSNYEFVNGQLCKRERWIGQRHDQQTTRSRQTENTCYLTPYRCQESYTHNIISHIIKIIIIPQTHWGLKTYQFTKKRKERENRSGLWLSLYVIACRYRCLSRESPSSEMSNQVKIAIEGRPNVIGM